MKLSIIIVSFNGKEFLRKCIDSIRQNISSSTKHELIVVDNASDDDSVDMIAKEFPRAVLIRNDENFGFSKANNQAIKKATGDYILFLNPDTLIRENVIAEMITFMEINDRVGAVTCRVELPNGQLDDSCHRGFPTPWNAFCYFSGLAKMFPCSKLFSGYSLGWLDINSVHEIDACAGAFMMVRREAGEKIGWWDEDYFWYGEDLDFCYRLKQKGWKIFFVPSVSILHYKGVSGGIKRISQHVSTATRETKIRATKARHEAMRIFYRKHYEKKYPRLIHWLVDFIISVRLFVSLRFLNL